MTSILRVQPGGNQKRPSWSRLDAQKRPRQKEKSGGRPSLQVTLLAAFQLHQEQRDQQAVEPDQPKAQLSERCEGSVRVVRSERGHQTLETLGRLQASGERHPKAGLRPRATEVLGKVCPALGAKGVPSSNPHT